MSYSGLQAKRRIAVLCSISAALVCGRAARAEDPASQPASEKYGAFGLLDHRSIYGKYWFPEPLRADEADVDNEVRFDYFHAEKSGHQFDSGHLELEKSFGNLTLEIAPGYESDRTQTFNPATHKTERETEEGFTNIELGARYPLFQYVSPNGVFDTTFVFGLEVSPPVESKISKDIEFVPKLFNLTRIGEHFSVQWGFGDSILVGPQDHGLSTLEYDLVFGYELTDKQVPLPGVYSFVPLLEFDGEYTMNQEDAGDNQLFGVIGARFNFYEVKWLPAQPRLGVGYTFPIDQGARNEFRWGVVTSLVFEY